MLALLLRLRGLRIASCQGEERGCRRLVNGSEGDTVLPCVVDLKNTRRVGRQFNGLIDDVALWGRALTAQEVRSIYDAGLGGAVLDDGDGFVSDITDSIDPEDSFMDDLINFDDGILTYGPFENPTPGALELFFRIVRFDN